MSVARDMRDDGAGTHLSIGMSLVGSIEARRELERLPRGEWWSRRRGRRRAGERCGGRTLCLWSVYLSMGVVLCG